MDLLIVDDEATLAAAAADRVACLLADRPGAHLCLAAGGSPRRLYAELARRAGLGCVSFDAAWITQLDEWCGVPRDDPAACAADLAAGFVQPLGIRAEQYLGLDSAAPDSAAEVRRFAAGFADRGPLDLAILGLGLNGHLGMNEPADELIAGPHVAKLAEESRGHALLRGLERVPTHGMTLGLDDLMLSAEILLLVSGEAKQEALRRAVRGPITTRFPASLLQLHRGCCIVADAAAAGLLVY